MKFIGMCEVERHFPGKYLCRAKPISAAEVRNSHISCLAASVSELESENSLIAGYRHLHVNYDRDNFLFDMSLTGPIFGVSFGLGK